MPVYLNRCISFIIAWAAGLGLSLVLLAGFTVDVVQAAGPGCSVNAGGSGDYSSIQDAVDDPGCSTITVDADIYNENVTIAREVTIEGAGPGSTIVDGGGSGDVFRVSTNGVVTVSKMTIRHGERGVHINSSLAELMLDNVEVVSNTCLDDDGVGIKFI